jgi:hypothetical protein
MEFGLLPEFSTPVQKPVEIPAALGFGTNFGRVLLHFSKAKVQKPRFDAVLGAWESKVDDFVGCS